jgi:hypothetical protein
MNQHEWGTIDAMILITGFPTIANDFRGVGTAHFFLEAWGSGSEESIRGVSHSSKISRSEFRGAKN